MIELRTGVPGSGKTLSMVQALSRFYASLEKNPELGRPVFVHNIRDLSLPHAVLPVKEGGSPGRLQLVPVWEEVPDGSLIIIDECQDLFPPRSSQSQAPAHISFFNTHRHRGIDIWLTTQHPKLIDFSVRALIGKHMHYRRLFGGNRATVYEWDACSDNLGGFKDAVKTFWSFPKDAYKFYKSAEVHTKQSFKLPRWLLIPLAGLALGAFFIPRAYTVLTSAVTGKGIAASTPEKAGQGGAAASPAIAGASAGHPLPAPAPPVQPPMTFASAPSVLPVPVFAGCIALKARCSCFDVAGQLLEKEPEFCETETALNRPAPLPAHQLPEPKIEAVAVVEPAPLIDLTTGRQKPSPW